MRTYRIKKDSWSVLADILRGPDDSRTPEPFKTAGSLQGEAGTFTSLGRLPSDWQRTLQARRGYVDYVIYSYATPIAWHDVEAGWIVPEVSYSITTTIQQNQVRAALHEQGYSG